MKRIFSISLFVLLFLASNCFALTFRYIEVVSDNRRLPGLDEWRFSTDILLNPPLDSYDALFSFLKDDIITTGSLAHILFGTNHVYDSGAIGEEPPYYKGLDFFWDVDGEVNSINATGKIPSSVMKVAPSENVTISGNPIHPTISWTNSDFLGLSQYRLRVVLADDLTKLLWETIIQPPSQSVKYTICGFSFKPDVPYLIRIEARQPNISFLVTGTGLPIPPNAFLLNRSTVFVPYEYPAPDPTEDVFIDHQTGLEWVAMYRTVCTSPESIMDGTDSDGLAAKGWQHATIQQITELLKNAGMIEPFNGTSWSGNYEAANFLLDALGHTYEYSDNNGKSLSIKAFSAEGPSPTPSYLYTPVVIVGNMLTGNVGGADVPGPSVPSSVSNGEIGNWLVRPHVDETPPTLAPLPDKTILWPPNHKMVTVSIAANASDDSAGPVTLAATVSSNEPENGLGDGDTAPDWTTPFIDQENGIITLQFRAERSGRGNGRVYTVTITATDESGNTAQADVDIIVPRDKGKK